MSEAGRFVLEQHGRVVEARRIVRRANSASIIGVNDASPQP